MQPSNPGRTRHRTVWPRRHAAATARPAHHERDAFRSAAHGPMRRDYALNRFLHLTAKYRRA